MEALLTDTIPGTLKEAAQRFAGRITDPRLKRMFTDCFMNTLDTTVRRDREGVYIITGDIDAMWLRDSSAQVMQYLLLAGGCAEARKLILDLSARQMRCILTDPYANAFNQSANGKGWTGDETEMHPMVFERKFELDSLCYPLWLAVRYFKRTGDKSIFDHTFRRALSVILDTFETETRHGERSKYRHYRPNEPPALSIPNRGKGGECAFTGMIWSGYRPSDDACAYGYFIPGNMFVSVVLGLLPEIRTAAALDSATLDRAERLKAGVDEGIARYGTIEHPVYGKMYVYETDGLGHYQLMDDANVPSLLSLPYLGYCAEDDPIYRNTRRFVLGKGNPYWYEGGAITGVGSPHTPKDRVWPIAVIMEALTTSDRAVIDAAVRTVMRADGGTGYVHESVHKDDPSVYSREWFAWANSLFAYFLIEKAGSISLIKN